MTRRYFKESQGAEHKLDVQTQQTKEVSGVLASLLGNVKSDDLILVGLILFLLQSECRDKELLFVLGFLFISG